MADHVVDLRIVEGGQCVDVRGAAGGAPQLGQGMGHRRLHPDAQHVELEQADVLHVVLVELAHRETAVAGFQWSAFAQRRVAQDHPAGVQGDVSGQSVEGLDQLEEEVQTAFGQAGGAQFGQVPQGLAGVAGTDVWEGLGDGVGFVGRHAERGGDIAHGVAHPVGLQHRDAGHPVAAEGGEDLLVDLRATGGLDVEVDVRQRLAQRGQEALHHQPVPDRVHPGDAQQVVDQAAGPRTAGGAADAHVAHQLHHLCDGQEVGDVAQPGDHVEFVIEPGAHGLGHGAIAVGDTGLTAAAQFHHGLLGGGAQGLEFRQVDLTQTQVASGVQPAAQRQHPGVGQQSLGTSLPTPGEPGHVFGQLQHLLATLEVCLGIAPVHSAGVQRDEPPGGVQHVEGDCLATFDHPDLVGEHTGQAVLVGDGEHPGGLVGAADPVTAGLVVGDGDD